MTLSVHAAYTVVYALNTSQKRQADALDADWANSTTGVAFTDAAGRKK